MYLVLLFCVVIGVRNGLNILAKTRSGVLPGVRRSPNPFYFFLIDNY